MISLDNPIKMLDDPAPDMFSLIKSRTEAERVLIPNFIE